MNVLALVPSLYDTSPGQRFRVEQWARHLERTGSRFTFVPFESRALHRVIYQPGRYGLKTALMLEAFARRFRTLALARQFDVVLIHREAALMGPAVIERLVARAGIPIVFDFDDAIWVPYVSPANNRLSYLKCFGKAASICRLSAHILAGNGYLADYAGRYNTHVTVVPCTIDTDTYLPRPIPENAGSSRPITIGWTGSYSTVQHLDTLRGTLMRLHRRHSFQLNVIGTPEYRLDGVPTIAQAWCRDSEARDLHSFDIGIMPLPNDAWSRGKCGLKLLQYMAAGVAAVASPVGVNTEIVQDGVNGFLAATEDEWIEKLSALIRDGDLRRRIGAAGRRTVEELFSARVWVPRIQSILESAASRTVVHRAESLA
jgi:glycosyltransferase involved in cell wall biosynthesis